MHTKLILVDVKLFRFPNSCFGCSFDISYIKKVVLATTLCIRIISFRSQINHVWKILQSDDGTTFNSLLRTRMVSIGKEYYMLIYMRDNILVGS